MNFLKKKLFQLVLPGIVRNCCESTIPRSGEVGQKVNCFILAFDLDDSPYFVTKSYTDEQLAGLRFNGEKYVDQHSINLADTEEYKLRLVHYYGLDQIVYDSIYDFVWHKLTRYIYLKVHIRRQLESVSQYYFNKRMLVTKRRMDLLRFMLRDQIDRTHDGITPLDLMTKLYTIKWILHPSADEKQQELELYLESLVYSNDLSKVNKEYVVTGRAVATLEKYEEDERKHSESVNLQRIMVMLTILLAIFTMFQSGLVKVPTILDLTTENSHNSKIHPTSFIGG